MRKTLWIAAAVFALNILCNAVFFLPGEGRYRDSIEGGYASMARFIAEHPDPFGWNPMQYYGLPTHMWYLPGVPYASALCIKLLPFLRPEHVYRLVVSTMLCLVPVTVFLFAAYFSRSRKYAVFTALSCTIFSPAYYYFLAIDLDRGIVHAPWRVQTVLKYGEGPHTAGLALLPLALIAAWRAGCRRRYADIFLAAVLFAAVTLTNWVAGLALAWCCAMMLLTGAGSAHETGFLARRVVAAAALAYLLACFWLTPDYIHTVAFNWPHDAFGFQFQTSRRWLLAGLLVTPVIVRIAFLRAPGITYPLFLFLCLFGFTYAAGCHYWWDAGPVPESRRYALEAEIFAFLFVLEILRRIMATDSPARVIALSVTAILLSMGLYQIRRYPHGAWIMLRPDRREASIEYKVASALNDLHPAGRVQVGGGTRFRLNSWFPLPQVGGTFESGLKNRTATDVVYSLRTGIGIPAEQRAATAVRQIRYSGVEYVAIHGRKSREHWKDFVKSSLPFGEMFEKVWQDEDDAIYRVPFRGYAHLVKESEIPRAPPIGDLAAYLEAYIAAIDDPSRPRLLDKWDGTNGMTIEGGIPAGMSISVMVSYDDGWEALQDGRAIPVERDGSGYIVLRVTPSQASRIEMRYRGSTQQKVFTAISAAAWIAALVGLRRSLRRGGKPEAAR